MTEAARIFFDEQEIITFTSIMEVKRKENGSKSEATGDAESGRGVFTELSRNAGGMSWNVTEIASRLLNGS